MIYIRYRGELIALLEDQYSFFFFVNDFLSIFFTVTLCFLPLFVLCFYSRKFDRLPDKDFKDKYGSGYDSLKTNKRSILFFPVFFLVRRYFFTFLAFTMTDE